MPTDPHPLVELCHKVLFSPDQILSNLILVTNTSAPVVVHRKEQFTWMHQWCDIRFYIQYCKTWLPGFATWLEQNSYEFIVNCKLESKEENRMTNKVYIPPYPRK